MLRHVAVRAFSVGLAAALALASAGCGKTSAGGGPSGTQATSSPNTQVQFFGAHYPAQGHTHLAPGTSDTFKYNSNPPTSGSHRELFTGQFISPNPLPRYIQVHLLEHGNVLLQYNCSCPEIAAQLADIAGQFDTRLYPPNELQPTVSDVQNAQEQGTAVIVAPNPNMKSKIALTAWTRLATLDKVDRAKIVSFINQWLHNQANLAQ